MIWRDTWTRMSGRHRRGEPVMPVPPRPWDVAKQAAARQLDLIEPAWTVWYGLSARRFYAVATWPAPEPLIVQARTADELCDLMREAEQATPSPTWLVPDGPAQPSPNRPVTGEPAQPSPARLVPTRPAQPPPPSLTAPAPAPSTADRPGPARRTPPPLLPIPPAHTSPPPRGAPMPVTPDGLRTVCWDLPHDPSAVGEARGMVRETLTRWALPSLADDVVLVVGELLANAITYGDPPVRLSVWAGTDELCVRVTDHGPDRPRHLDLGVEAAHGRGLTIVEALADASGVTPLPDTPGKTVWARWRLFSPAANPSHTTSPPGHRAHRGTLSLPGPERNDRPR